MRKFHELMAHLIPKIGNLKPIKRWLFNHFNIRLVDVDEEGCEGWVEIYSGDEFIGASGKNNVEFAALCHALSYFKIVQILVCPKVKVR